LLEEKHYPMQNEAIWSLYSMSMPANTANMIPAETVKNWTELPEAELTDTNCGPVVAAGGAKVVPPGLTDEPNGVVIG
jgi:hypothetical protein